MMEELKILFEDDSIIVTIKPVGVLSQADDKSRENMVCLLKNHTNGEIFPLHRLDRDVSGVMVYAKTKQAAAVLSEDIRNNKFVKEYIALIHSKPEKDADILEDLLFKDSTKGKSFVVKKERKGVKKAKLEYSVIKSFFIDDLEYSIVKIRLFTGRTHQIRVQFASRKMSLAGDKKYGAKDGFSKIGLWSYSLTFCHPKTKEELSFQKAPENYISNYL